MTHLKTGILRPRQASKPMSNSLSHFVSRLAAGWAARSLAVGAVATAVDIGVLLACVHWFGFANPAAAAAGVAVGSTVAFIGNRRFAFRDADPEVRPQLLRFMATTSVGMGAHAALVHVLADLFAVPVVLAKMIADLAVFGLGQLFLLRYVVFPPAKELRSRHRRAVLFKAEDVRDSAARAA
jgi:putative flippase GtrA